MTPDYARRTRLFPALLFLFVCFSCTKNIASPDPAEEEVVDEINPYIWEKTGDTWDITLRAGTSFLLDQPWSLYLFYSWTGTEEELPLELCIQGKTVFDFFPKTTIVTPHRFQETFIVFHSEQWKDLPAEITVKAESGHDFTVTSIRLESREMSSGPLAADPGTMMNYPSSSWRNESYEVFFHNLYPGLLYLVTDSFAMQSLFLKRLAFFTEKPGFTGRLARDEEIAGLRDWFAHDYKAGDLAAFFDLARKQNFPLNSNELLLRELLLKQGIIKQENGAFGEGKGALLGFSIESKDRLKVYYVHESVHGLEFIIPELQKIFLDFFDSLSGSEKIFIRDALLYRGYNVIEDKQLLASEAAAYLLQQRPEETDQYFKDYVMNWYVAYHKDTKTDFSEENGKTAVFSDNITAFLAANRGIFGRRSAALQKEFLALTGLQAGSFYDLLPRSAN